jgi:hypothetical protein
MLAAGGCGGCRFDDDAGFSCVHCFHSFFGGLEGYTPGYLRKCGR